MSHEDQHRASTWPHSETANEQPLLPRRLSEPSQTSTTQHYDPPPQSTQLITRKPIPSSFAVNGNATAKEPHSAKDHHRYQRKLTTTLRWWIPELLASLMAVISLLAIVAVLRVYDGYTLTSLALPHSLSLNSLVAILATLNRMFLTVPLASCISQEGWLSFVQKKSRARRLQDLASYDDAAKGAWGSLLFIFKAPGRLLPLAAALVMIVSLGISTFVQQLITFQEIAITHPSLALQPGNLTRSTYYDKYVGAPGQGGPIATLDMSATIYSGILDVNRNPDNPPCQSGNCTWPLLPTLAVCGGCASTSPINSVCKGSICNYTLPSGNVFQLANFGGLEGPTLGVGFQSQFATHGGKHWNASLGDRYYVANWEQMGAPAFDGLRSVYVTPNLYFATECALWMCVNTYNVSMQSGTLNQTLVSSSHRADVVVQGGWIWGKGHEGNPEYTLTSLNTTSAAATGNGTEQYTISLFGGEGIAYYFYNLLDTSGTIDDRGYFPDGNIAQGLWTVGGSASWISSLAESVTNVLRSEANTYDPAFGGTAYSQGVRIVWWWITLPAAAVTLATILLFVTMFRTHRSEVNAWKGSPLMFLFCEVDEDLKTEAQTAACFDDVNGMAKMGKQRVTFRLAEKGRWMFEKT